jgi:secondary thiamine-phosphate synthase enzyme
VVPNVVARVEIGGAMDFAPLVASGRTELSTNGDSSFIDLSGAIGGFLAEHEAWEGILVAFVPGSTAGITTIEYESGALEDLQRTIDRIAPRGGDYAHDLRWGDGNGFSHVRAALIGPSISIPVQQGRPTLGTWQQVVLCDFDNRPRRRTVLMQFTGNCVDANGKD